MRLEDTKNRILSAHVGDDEPFVERIDGRLSLLSDIEIHGKGTPHQYLKAGGDPDTNAHRLELIQALRDGKHIEVVVKRALAYRQKKGMRNRRGLRFNDAELEPSALTWKNQPFLLNHNTYEQEARKGTILTSEFGHDPKGAMALWMGFAVVKPDAAISVLDGTIDRFSIGWFSTGPVLCTVHGCDIRSRDACSCWPLDEVELDGKTKIVEYEYQSFTGKELSAVNVPAVIGTKIEEYRAALSAELELPPRPPRNIKEPTKMRFTRLAAALSLTALTEDDEGQFVLAVEGLRQRVATAELDAGTLRAENARLTADLALQTALAVAASNAALDRSIADAYTAGKLTYGKDAAGANTPSPLESLLRDYGRAAGADALAAKITAMPKVIPLGVAPPAAGEPPRTEHAAPKTPTDQEMESVAAQLGVSVDDIRARYGLKKGAAQ